MIKDAVLEDRVSDILVGPQSRGSLTKKGKERSPGGNHRERKMLCLFRL